MRARQHQAPSIESPRCRHAKLFACIPMERVLGSASTAPRTFGVSWPLLVALLTLFGVLLGLAPGAQLGDPDVYWHLAAGRWIVEHGTLPNGDPFSHSMPGAPWMLQSWLTEVVFALLYR